MTQYDPKKKRPKNEDVESVVDDIFGEETQDSSNGQDSIDNVLPLYPEAQDTPLIMQPQVWVATGVALLAFIFLLKRRKKG